MATNPASLPAPPASERRDSKLLILILAIGVQLAIVGAYLGAKTLSAGEGAAHAHVGTPGTPPPGGFGVGSDVKTSFGSIVVGTAQNLPGVPPKALGGASHGIGGYVGPKETQVQVTVVITNRTRNPIPYSPSQFSLRSGGADPIAVTKASIKPATLLPDAAVEATLIFVAPRNGQKLSLAFQDRGRTAPFLIDIGHVDTTPKGTDDHTHP